MTEMGKMFWRGQAVDEMSQYELRQAVNELCLLYSQSLQRNCEAHTFYGELLKRREPPRVGEFIAQLTGWSILFVAGLFGVCFSFVMLMRYVS